MAIDVIVCSKHGGELFRLCLVALLRQKELGKVVVVTPTQDSDTYKIASRFEDITIVVEPPNSCLAKARRLGVDYCTAPFVTYVDADVILGKDHLSQLHQAFVKAEAQLQSIVVIEGILQCAVLDKGFINVEDRYKPSILRTGARGCTHNTLFRREVLATWHPPYAHAWEDFLLTQHIQQMGGYWIRYQQPAHSIHVRDYGMFRRSRWDTAGERVIKPDLSIFPVLKRAIIIFATGVRDWLKKRDIKVLVTRSLIASGSIVGFYTWSKHVKLILPG